MEAIRRGVNGNRLFTPEFKREQLDRLSRGAATAAEQAAVAAGELESVLQRCRPARSERESRLPSPDGRGNCLAAAPINPDHRRDFMQRWEVLSRQSVFKVSPWIEVLRECVRLPTGRVVDEFYAVELPNYAVVVALTPTGHVVAERHYKHASRAVTYGLPGGYLGAGEGPLVGAQRELREETGYIAPRWSPLGSFVVDGNRGCGTAHFFLARDAEQRDEPDGGDLEQTEIHLLPLDELVRTIRAATAAEMCTATALGLAHFEMMRDG